MPDSKQSVKRPGYIFDNHKNLVQELFSILDRAVVDHFPVYLKDWARRREEG